MLDQTLDAFKNACTLFTYGKAGLGVLILFELFLCISIKAFYLIISASKNRTHMLEICYRYFRI